MRKQRPGPSDSPAKERIPSLGHCVPRSVVSDRGGCTGKEEEGSTWEQISQQNLDGIQSEGEKGGKKAWLIVAAESGNF